MSITATQNVQDELEAMIDRNGLYRVVEMLENIAYDKAEHLQVNWQDNGAAKRWLRAAAAIEKLQAKLHTIQMD